MSTGIVSFLAYSCISITALAADCDCAHFPIKPEACARQCQAALLQKVSKDDLMDKVKLESSTADALVMYRQNHTIKDVSALKDGVPTAKVLEIKTKLDALDDKDAADLAKEYKFSKIKQEPAPKWVEMENAKSGESSAKKAGSATKARTADKDKKVH